MGVRRRVGVATVAAMTAMGMLGACSKDTTSDSSAPASAGEITLVVDSFGDFGYAALAKEYEASHPGVKVELRSVQKLDDYKPQLTQWLAAGSGAGDVVALEEGILNEFKAQPQNFVEPDGPRRRRAGGQLPALEVGARQDRRRPADRARHRRRRHWRCATARTCSPRPGCRPNRDEVSKLWPTWDEFIATGKKFKAAKTGAKGFVDSATTSFNAILFQSGETNYYDKDRPAGRGHQPGREDRPGTP